MTATTFTNSFNHLSNGGNMFSRRWGANSESFAVDPYITGYHFIKFAHFPNLTSMLPSTSSMNLAQIKNALCSLCTSVTIPGATLNKAEFTGLGNIKFFYPTNADWDNTVSLRFTEMSGAPILRIFHAWTQLICDYKSGINYADYVTKSNYTASMYYWTTRPDGITVEFHSLITGMFPMKDPTDQFGHDLTTIDKLEIDIDFSCDIIYQEDFTYAACSSYAQEYRSGSADFRNVVYPSSDSAEAAVGGF